MAACLCNDSHSGVYQNDCQVSGGAAGNHITRILFVSRSIGNNEFTIICREITVGYVNRNALFTFRFQAIQ